MANAKTDYSLSVNVGADISEARKTIEQFTQGATTDKTRRIVLNVDANIDNANQQFENLLGKNLVTKVDNSMERISTKIRTNLKGMIGNVAHNDLIKVTEQFKNSLGDVQERVTVLTENGKALGSSLQTIKHGISEVNTETSTTTQTLNGIETKLTTVTKTLVDTAGNEQKIIETTKEWTDASGKLNTEITTLNGNNEQIAPTITKVSDATNKASNANKNLSTSASQVNKQMQGLGWTLTDAFKRLANFYLASLPLKAFQTAISNATETIKDFDSAITEMGKVSEYSGDKLQKYTQDLADLGTEVARTQTEMTEAATGWLKAGYSEEDAALLSKYSALLQNTADEELSAADATSILVSQLKAYHMEAEEAIKVTDIINAVSAQQAVSSYDISQGLTVASAAMSTFGNSIEETTALLTAGTTIFQGRSTQVARGLNMIATRVAKNRDELKKYGVDINDSNGQLKSTFQILQELSPTWDKMSKAEQVALGNILAGTNQYKIFAAVMSQMDVAVESYDQALNSSGETMKQNAVYMESLEAKTTALKAEFEKLVLGDGGLQSFAKNLIEGVTSVLEFIDALGGLPTLLITITSLLIAINGIKIYTWITNIAKGIENLAYIIPNAISAWQSYAAGIVSANTAMQASMPVIGLIAVAIGGLISYITAYNRKIDEQNKKIKENIATFSQEYQSLDDATKKLQNEKISREELNSIIDGNVDKYEAERLKLLDDNEARKETIKLIEEEKKARAQEVVDTGLSAYEEALENIQKRYEEFDDIVQNVVKVKDFNKEMSESGIFMAKTAEEQVEALKKYKDILIDTRSDLIGNAKEQQKYTNEIKRVETALSTLDESFSADKKTIKEFNEALSVLNLHYDETTKTIEKGSKKSYIAIEEERKGKEKLLEVNEKEEESIDSLIKKYELEADAITETMTSNELSYEEAVRLLAAQSQSVEDSKEAWEELDKAYEESIEASSALISSISSVSSALDEQDKNGSIAVKTQLELIEAGYGAALSYDKETGACKLNKDAVENLVQAKLEMQIANLQIARSNIVNQLISEANAATVSAGAFLELAKAKKVASEAYIERGGADPSKSYAGYGGNFGYLTTESKKATDQIEKLNEEIHALESSLKTVKTGGVSAFKAAGDAAKSAKNATDDLKKSLEDLKSQYEKVISYLSSEYDRKISELEKAKDKELKIIDEEIDALEKEKDEEIKKIDEEIKKLKEEEDAFVKTTKTEIEEIKKRKESLVKALEEEIDALEKEKKEFKKRTDEKIKALEKEKKTFQETIDKQIDALEKEKKAFKKSIENEIDDLEAKKKAFTKSVEEQAETLKKEQKAIVKNIEAESKALKEKQSTIIKSIEEESKALKQQKEERQKYWEERIDAFRKENDERKDAIELQEKLDALERAKNTKVKIYKEGEGFVYDVDQTKVQEAQKELDEYLSEKAYEEELERLNNLKDAELQNFTDRLDNLNNYKEEVNEYYSQQLEDLSNYKDQVNEYYTQQLESLDEYKEQELEKFDAQLEELKAYKERKIEQYDDELEKIKEEREETLEQYDIALEELKEYESHKLEEYEKEIEDLKEQEEKIKDEYDKKIEDLEDYLEKRKEKYEKEIKDLEDRKDKIAEQYDKELEKLKERRQTIEEEYDAEIEKYREYKQEFQDMVDAYEREQTRLLAEQLTGISLENDNWMTRLENLQAFVNAYNALLAQLNTDMPSTPSTPTPETPNSPTPTTPTQPSPEPKKVYVPTDVPISDSGEIIIYPHAKGVNSVKDNELAVVGENPNKEIVLGSKLNNGELMSLNKGTGVVNANSTNTLAGMLNQVGNFGSSGFGSGNGVLNNNINNDSLVVNGVTIQGSNISDPQTFVNGLLNLKSEALQRAYRHS